MSNEGGQPLFLILFFVGFLVFTIGEAYWLHKKKGVTAGRAFAFSFASHIFAITVGLFFSSVVFVAFVAMARGQSLEVAPSATIVLLATITSFIVPAAILVLVKWLLLRFLKITAVERPLAYSIVASAGFFFSVLILPFMVEYLRVQ